jgi:hypothetical protein
MKYLIPTILLLSGAAVAADAPGVVAKVAAMAKPQARAAAAKPAAKTETDAKELSGMSILGNQEAPKALVIVPWKSTQLGDTLGIAKTLDDGRQPVDKDVFMRQLSYYEIRTGAK